MPRYSDEGWWPPPSRPRKAKGGIKARSRRGGFGESWWARRWIEVLESFPIGARLQRGRSYARTGQVLSIDIAAGVVTATVQGSRARPYRVSVRVPAHPARAWRSAAGRLATEARYGAAILAGELPPEIETLLREHGLPLFPASPAELDTDCSCPDWSNPCKHVAAVCYLVAEELDRDPFLLFTLRGLDRQLLADVVGAPAMLDPADGRPSAAPPVISDPVRDAPTADRATVADASAVADFAAVADSRAPTLPPDPSAFWGDASFPAPVPQPESADATAALVRSLGPFPFWRGASSPPAAFEVFYRRASELGAAILGDALD